jgi:hypothetical protein
MLLKSRRARAVDKVGFENNRTGRIVRMAKIGDHTFLAIEPYAHGSESIGQIGPFDRYLDGQYGALAWQKLNPTKNQGRRLLVVADVAGFKFREARPSRQLAPPPQPWQREFRAWIPPVRHPSRRACQRCLPTG